MNDEIGNEQMLDRIDGDRNSMKPSSFSLESPHCSSHTQPFHHNPPLIYSHMHLASMHSCPMHACTMQHLVLESIVEHGQLVEAGGEELHGGGNDGQFSLLGLPRVSLTPHNVPSLQRLTHLLKLSLRSVHSGGVNGRWCER